MNLVPHEMTAEYIALLAGVTLLNTTVAMFALFFGKEPIGLGRIALTALLVGGLAAVEVLFLVSLGLSMFGVIHVAWQHTALVIPTAGAGLLLGTRGERGTTTVARAVALFACIGYPVAAWAWFVEPRRIVLEEAVVALNEARAGDDPIRIGVLADIQTRIVGSHEREAVRRLMAEAPDLILLPGDVFQGGMDGLEEQLSALRELLSELSAPGGVFIVTGNTDVKGEDGLQRILEGTDVRMLDDQITRIVLGDRRLTILGLGENTRGSNLALIRNLESLPGHDDIRIVLVHRPDPVLHLSKNSRVDLVVAGHTHGGQVALPFFGPPLTLTHVPRHVAAGGLSNLDGRRIYVSRGLGMERMQAPRVRFLCAPEVSALTLQSTTEL